MHFDNKKSKIAWLSSHQFPYLFFGCAISLRCCSQILRILCKQTHIHNRKNGDNQPNLVRSKPLYRFLWQSILLTFNLNYFIFRANNVTRWTWETSCTHCKSGAYVCSSFGQSKAKPSQRRHRVFNRWLYFVANKLIVNIGPCRHTIERWCWYGFHSKRKKYTQFLIRTTSMDANDSIKVHDCI